jgi:hypothetical protein
VVEYSTQAQATAAVDTLSDPLRDAGTAATFFSGTGFTIVSAPALNTTAAQQILPVVIHVKAKLSHTAVLIILASCGFTLCVLLEMYIIFKCGPSPSPMHALSTHTRTQATAYT